MNAAARRLDSEGLVLVVAAFVLLSGNGRFFARLLDAYPPASAGPAAPWLLGAFAFLVLALPLALIAWGRQTKPVLAFTLLLSALCSAFMDSYGIAIDAEMLRNVARTDWREAGDLLTPRLVGHVMLLGVLPTWLLSRHQLAGNSGRRALAARLKLLALLLALVLLLFVAASDLLASFVRNHKAIRSFANPAYPLYSLGKFVARDGWSGLPSVPSAVAAVAPDARIAPHDKTRDLLFIVVGETARADHFGLNGYARDTTPELRAAGAISFADVESCGTSTAYSVPCMFSSRGRAGFDRDKFAAEENLLDVIRRAGVHVLWLDNNSSSQGVASRIEQIDFRTPAANSVCDIECRDEGMLVDLQRRIDAWPDGDIVVVLHQMGNHGPAYYKRYPRAFARYLPDCQRNDLGACASAEIVNAYDNAIAYTDHFLAQAISLLRRNQARFDTGLIYMSDHGESLGENGVWLHGMPRTLAPRAQTHVPAIVWLGEPSPHADLAALRARRNERFSHDNLFHTVLGFLDIRTASYRRDLDMLAAQAAP